MHYDIKNNNLQKVNIQSDSGLLTILSIIHACKLEKVHYLLEYWLFSNYYYSCHLTVTVPQWEMARDYEKRPICNGNDGRRDETVTVLLPIKMLLLRYLKMIRLFYFSKRKSFKSCQTHLDTIESNQMKRKSKVKHFV